MMAVIGKREFKYIMKLDDQTRRERQSLNKGLGDIEKSAKRAAKASSQNIMEVAKASKRGMEGLKAVFQLGGWLMLVNGIVKGVTKITAEARKSSREFREAEGALKGLQQSIGKAIVNKLAGGAEGFRDMIIYARAGIENLPGIMALAGVAIKKIFKRAFEWETIKATFVNTIENLIDMLKSMGLALRDILLGALSGIVDPAKSIFTYLKDVFDKLFSGRAKEIVSPKELFRQIASEGKDAFGKTAAGWIALIKARSDFEVDQLKDTKALYNDILSDFAAGVKKLTADDVARLMVEAANLAGGALADGPSKEAVQAGTELGNRFSAGYGASNTGAIAAQVAITTGEKIAASVKETLKGSEFAAGSAFDINPILASFDIVFGIFSQLASVGALLSPMSTILKSMMDVLGPIIDNLLAPLVGVLKVIGYTIASFLAPALEILRPIITAIASIFVWVYNNIVVPVHNFILLVFNKIYNAFASFLNGIFEMIDSIPLVDFGYRIGLRDERAGFIEKIDMEGLNAAGASGGSGGGGGASASYAAGTSIKIEKIEIKADFIAGDAGLLQVAQMLRDKIEESERLGM